MSCEHNVWREAWPVVEGRECLRCLKDRLATAERERQELVTSGDVFRRQRDEAREKLAVAVEALDGIAAWHESRFLDLHR